MKRSEIKIPDVSAISSAAAQMQQQQSQNSPAAVFAAQRPLIEMPSTTAGSGQSAPPPATTTQISLPRVAHGAASGTPAGVTVYRSDPQTNQGGSGPPVAHTGGVAQGLSGGSVQPPPAAHHGQAPPATVVTQPPTNIKPEHVALPTTPMSLQYATATTTYSGGPPLKSLTAQTAAGIVQSVAREQQSAHQAHAQQMIHQKTAHQTVGFGTPAIRTITTANLSSVPNVSSVTGSGNAASIGATLGQGSAQFQRLKVEDALSYLDQVKYKFGNQPQVYNDFLDIMKEFKSQSIDTPGVIQRVSCLFKGHPELIVGFNTFLPPGYKIEIAVSMPGILGAGMQTIVHTPHGVHTMAALGQLSTITTTPAGTGGVANNSSSAVRSVTIAAPSAAGQPKYGQQHTTTTTTTPAAVIESTNDTFHPNVHHPSLGNLHSGLSSEVSLVPQAPPAGHHLGQQPQVPNVLQGHGRGQQHHGGGGQQQQQQQQQQQPPPQRRRPHRRGGAGGGGGGGGGGNQPVEFNHAINYVNKIKNRFAGQPDVYKQFLEILHTYQKDQKAIKDGRPPTGRFLTEGEVYAQVAKLFQSQEDLLSEFGQFLPEATNDNLPAGMMSSKGLNNDHTSAAKRPAGAYKYGPGGGVGGGTRYGGVGGKRPQGGISHPPPKKPKLGVLRDVSLAEAGKYGTLNEYAFFDKVRKALRNKEVYEDFLRCLVLFNQEVISRAELVQLTSPFLNRHPELFKWFKDFVGYKDGPGHHHETGDRALDHRRGTDIHGVSPQGGRERISGDTAMEIDYATCKRLGASYCALPKNFVQPSCSGRSLLCREVLNDTWVSFPSWSEDSQFVTSRKTQYEEFIYRTEDERFEFDVVLETNKDTIKVLECVQKKMSRMPPEEAARYRLDDCLGGSSPTIHQRAIRRIYGEKAGDIIEGLKRNPVVAVPLVLRRLKAKDEEWREVQKNFNKIWRDQNEKYYLKSLDHQSLMFKQTDIRYLRSKSLLNELETLYDERHEQEESNANSNGEDNSTNNNSGGGGNNTAPVAEGPHMTVEYTDLQILDDVNNLLIHHVKRQTSIHKEDKHKIKLLLKHFFMDFFKHPRQELSDDERDEDEDSSNDKDNENEEEVSNGNNKESKDKDKDKDSSSKSTRAERARKKKEENKKEEAAKNEKNGEADKANKDNKEITEADIKVDLPKDGRRTPLHARDMEPDESYTHMMCNNNWCLFLRLHNILSERLTKMCNQAVTIANEESKDKKERKESIAVALRLKPKNEIEPEDYYPAFLDMVENLLDGNMEAQAYEDTLREMFGIHAYISFTLDKVVGNAVRQLQHLVTDEACVGCYDLFQAEKKNGATGGFCGTAADRYVAELVYQKKSEKLLADENCMKIFFYHQSGKMTIELLDTETEGQNSEQDEESTRKYCSYVDRFIQPGDEISEECRGHLTQKPVFLPRSIRSYNESPYGKMRNAQMQNHFVRREENDSGPPNGETDGTNEQTSSESDEKTPSAKKELFGEDAKDAKSANKVDAKAGVVYEDNLQCQFNPKNFKILYVINSENCFYRRLALTRAKDSHKAVSRRKTGDFNRWHSGWLKSNVSDAAHNSISEWFLGKCEGLVPNRTHEIVRADHDRTPYRTFYKYKADILKSEGKASAATTTTTATAPVAAASSTANSGGDAAATPAATS